ncbi:MAG: chitobiase/beta-hexosaminidase C-terminal domain-containing protein, partial [Lachnospiraceae bacterium]|nr:chitobiase/beta-hexosaminidase C-terminal domain-containing protein [Lachnospiraceae bacterium]
SVTPSTESLDFGAVAIGGTPSPATKTFSITGSDLTGNLSISADGGYTVSPTSVPASGTLSETNITVTPPSTATAGLKEGTITISGGGLSPDVTVSVSMLVEKTYDVNCALDFATIGSTGWSNSYQSHTVSKTGYEVVFAAASKQTTMITDIPVAKNTSVDLKLTDTNLATKYISAVKVVCRKWNTNSQTISLQYSVDGGETYTAFSPAVTSTTFTLEKLDLPAKVNALRFAASNNSQIGYASVHFDLVDKQTYNINKVETGCTLSVTNGTSAITSAEEGDEVHVSITGTTEGYENPVLTVKDADDNTITVSNGKFTMPAKAVTVTATATKKQYTVTLAATNGKIQVGGVDKTSIDVEHGDEVTLLAVADDDYAFQNWASEDFDIASPSNNPLTITIAKAGTITANFISTAKLNPGFAWSDASAVAVKGQEASLPTLTTNPYSLTPTYVSTNTDVAEINNAGEVTIKAVGSTTIKATYAEDPTYADCEATYTLTVKGRVTWHIIKEGVEETSFADYAKDVVPAKPVGVTSCDASISLVGWTTNTYAKSDAAPTPLYKEDVPVPAVTDNADYYAVWGVSSADSEASISEGVDTGGIIDGNGWTNSGAGSYASSGHGLKFDTQGDYITSPNISSENLKSVVVKFKAGYNAQQNSGSIFTIYAYDSDDNVLDSKTCEPETDFDDQNDYSYTLSGSATIAYVKIALTTRVANVGMEYAELFKVIPGNTSGYTTNCVGPVVVTDPEFNVATGTYYEVKTVKISNHDDDYLYFYTLDGTYPAADSNLDPTGTSVAYNHTTGIAINESCTLKAIAYDIDGNHSEVVSAAYVINLPLTTMDAIYEAAEAIGGTAQERVITFNNWVVSGVKDATAYITDGTKGFIIYTTSEGYHGLAVKDKISGTVTCQLKLFNKSAEVVGLTKADITAAGGSVTNDGVVTPVSKSISELSGVNTGAPVIISNVTYNGTNSTLVDEDANAIKPYTTLFNYGSTFENNKIYSVTGIYLQYSNTKELLPRQSEDIVLESKEQPTLKWYVNNTKETEIGATFTINKDDVFAPYFESNSDGAKTYSSTVGTVASIDPSTGALSIEGVGETVISCAVEAEGDYLAGSKSFTLKVRAEGSGDATWVAATWAAEEEVASNTKMAVKSPIAIDANLSMTWSKAEGSNDPIYHSDGEGRLYQKNTLAITASNSKQITRIEFHFETGYAGTISA